jgi:CRISPR-associated protein Cmr4
MSDFVKNYQVFAMTTDPVYIGTGGYTIGRVDNTIVRDPITNVPKIPGSSLAGVWRYYAVLEIFSKIKDDYRNIANRKDDNGTYKDVSTIFINSSPKWITNYKNNKYIRLKCAGQDDEPNKILDESRESETGHCGHCLVCKGFGFSKKDISWQGMIYFSDLNILFFPVFTMYGTRWITTVEKLKEAGLNSNNSSPTGNKVFTKNGNEGYINLGWLYLEVGKQQHPVSLNNSIQFGNFQLNDEDIVIVPDNLFSQIVNSNLEIRTSVSIDPITGAAKEGALFTSEAIPRGTILYGNIRIFDKSSFVGIDNRLEPLPSIDELECALKESKHFFETLGIGGMTTRGFGRLKIQIDGINDEECKKASKSSDASDSPDDQQKETQGGQ